MHIRSRNCIYKLSIYWWIKCQRIRAQDAAMMKVCILLFDCLLSFIIIWFLKTRTFLLRKINKTWAMLPSRRLLTGNSFIMSSHVPHSMQWGPALMGFNFKTCIFSYIQPQTDHTMWSWLIIVDVRRTKSNMVMDKALKTAYLNYIWVRISE